MNNLKFLVRSLSKEWSYTLVLEPDGTIINKLNESDNAIFGDEKYTFINRPYTSDFTYIDFNTKYLEKSQVPTATYDDYKSLEYAEDQ